MTDSDSPFLDALNRLEGYRGTDAIKWRQLKERALEALAQTTAYDEIRPFCEGGRDIDLPDEIAFSAYERLIDLGCDEPLVYRLYASRLELSGPEFDDKAQEMREAAKRLESD